MPQKWTSKELYQARILKFAWSRRKQYWHYMNFVIKEHAKQFRKHEIRKANFQTLIHGKRRLATGRSLIGNILQYEGVSRSKLTQNDTYLICNHETVFSTHFKPLRRRSQPVPSRKSNSTTIKIYSFKHHLFQWRKTKFPGNHYRHKYAR